MTMAGKHARRSTAADLRSGCAVAAAVLAVTGLTAFPGLPGSPGQGMARAQEAAAGAAPGAVADVAAQPVDGDPRRLRFVPAAPGRRGRARRAGQRACGRSRSPETDPNPVSLRRLLGQIHDQRDSKRSVVVSATRERLRIGADGLGFSVRSSHAGAVYVALLGSDGQTLTLLFPNALDTANTIGAGETLTLPRPNWTVTAGGPPGIDTLLVLVAEGPRDLGALRGGRAGPFVQPLTDAQGRARLPWLLGTNLRQGAGCVDGACSDAFGSALLSIEEY